MFLLKLYHQSNPTRQIESRDLSAGELRVGRDPDKGWRIEDPDRQISRMHCVFAVSGGQIMVKDTSANGIIVSRLRERVPRDVFVPLQLGDTVALGHFTITIEASSVRAAPPPLYEDIASPPPGSPFAPQGAQDHGKGLSRPAPIDPFGSALKPSPLDETPYAARGEFDRQHERRSLSSFSDDALARPDPSRAGDWNASSPQSQRKSHDALIGAPLDWVEPPRDDPSDLGFGFDAPFYKPILRAEPVAREALQIPSNWDAPPLGDTPPLEPAPRPPELDAPFRPQTPSPFPPELSPGPRQSALDPFGDRFEFGQPAPVPIPPVPIPPVPIPPTQSRPARPPEPHARAPNAPPSSGPDAAALLRAFCQGADLDPREFEGEDPVLVFQRAGALYQQMVLGLSDLLSERTSLKNEYRMVRTTVAPEGNNPFKWTPARRVGVDLLKANNQGFMTGPPAVREACEDLKKHLLCLLAGMRASVAATFKALDPQVIEAQVKDQSFVLRNKRAASSWSTYTRVYAEFRQAADDNPDSQINREFRAAYERQLGELDGLRSRS